MLVGHRDVQSEGQISNNRSRVGKIYISHIWFSTKALCEELHAKIDVVDEERYDIEAKVSHNNREVRTSSTDSAHIKNKNVKWRISIVQYRKISPSHYHKPPSEPLLQRDTDWLSFSADQRPKYQGPGPAGEV